MFCLFDDLGTLVDRSVVTHDSKEEETVAG